MTLSCDPTELGGEPPGVRLGGWRKDGGGLGQAGADETSQSSCYGPAVEPCAWKMVFQDLWKELVSLVGELL